MRRSSPSAARLARIAQIAVLSLIALLTGCSSVRVVQEAKSGGTLALAGPHDAARSKAEEHMRMHCPRGWQILEEGDALSTDGVSREWRITYACVGGPTAVRVIAF